MSFGYDYIITGGGLSGLSLALRILADPRLSGKTILLIEAEAKNSNDRTWCYWESVNGFFDELVYKRYRHIAFHSKWFSGLLSIAPYSYKMLRSKDVYTYGYERLQASGRVTLLHSRVEKVASTTTGAEVLLANGTSYQAQYLFNSIPFSHPSVLHAPAHLPSGGYYLLQHFMGWIVETDVDEFQQDQATFMDFRTPQTEGSSFVYVLPLSPRTALVEYTLFTAMVLPPEAYESALRMYIAEVLEITDYKITGIEKGIIPMTNTVFPRGEGNVVHMGTAGGDTKGSSGYTFQFVQKRCAAITAALREGRHPLTSYSLADKKYQLYDATLLRILASKKLGGDFIFGTLFQKNPAVSILRFLDNESSWWEELRIMHSVPTLVFGKAALWECWNKLTGK